MKDELDEKIRNIFANQVSKDTAKEFTKLISFVDATLAKGFHLAGEEKTDFMIKQLLNMRDFLFSSVITKNCYDSLNKKVLDSIESSVDMYEWTKKKEELNLEESHHDLGLAQENLSEKNQSTALEKEV